MTLLEYFNKYPSLDSPKAVLERLFVSSVFYPDFGDKGLEILTPQVPIYNDSTGENYFIDFVLETPTAKYAIETDGLYYHAAGAVSKEYFSKLQRKQNEIINQGYRLFRLTSTNIKENPGDAKYEMRRFFIADKYLDDLRKGVSDGIHPHEIQQEALEKLEETREKGNKRGLVCIATGVGKTYLSAFDVKLTESDKVLFVVHIKEILRQSEASFEDVLFDRRKQMGFLHGELKDIDKNIIFSSIQTIGKERYLKQFDPEYFDYIIIDETHHIAAESYRRLFEYFKPKKFFLGLTATRERTDRKEILPFFNNNLVYEIDQKTAIDKAMLVPYRYYGFKDDVDYSDIRWNGFKYNVQDLNKALMIERRDSAILDKFKEYCPNRKTIGFCVSIEHANYMADLFNRNGFSAIAIHSKSEDENSIDIPKETAEKIKAFRDGKYQVAFVVDMFNEGVDVKDVSCLLFLRPTESKTIFIQQMGRGLRLSPATNKQDVIILDFIGNYKTAYKILTGLGLTGGGLGGFVPVEGGNEREKKMLYKYDNNGSAVYFQDEVIDVLKEIQSASTKEVQKELISEKWDTYGKYLAESSRDNLYFKLGQQNKDIVSQLEAIAILKKNQGIDDESFKDLLKANNISGMTAGFRSLFLGKVLGLLKTPSDITEIFDEIQSRVNAKNGGDFGVIANYDDILTRQLEKMAYFSPINSPTNKYRSRENRVQYTQIGTYIIPFIALLINELREKYDYNDNRLSYDEIEFFAAFAHSLDEYESVAEMISEYRHYDNKPELTKYLRKSTEKADLRIRSILKYVSYFNVDNDGVKILDENIEAVAQKCMELKKLIDDNKIIDPSVAEEMYLKMLYSKESLIDFHNNHRA